MKLNRRLLIGATAVLAVAVMASAQNQAPSRQPAPAAGAPQASAGSAKISADLAASIEKRVEKFLRNVSAWGPEFHMQVGPINNSLSPDLYEVPVKVSVGEQSDAAIVYVSKDGKYIFSGEVADLDGDPLSDNRRLLHLEGFGSKGPADAKVTVVEFGDLECPDCRRFESVLRVLLPKYPQIRFVFKDFPLDQIHPWATIAAIAAHCVLQQSSDAFWKFHDALYDHQDLISSENATSKLAEYATAAGADLVMYQACLIDPKTADIVKASVEEGHALKVTGTPTIFVDGRRMVGPDQNLLQQYIEFDLNPAE